MTAHPGPRDADLPELLEDTGDPAAFLVSVQRGTAKLAALQPQATPVQLTPDERAELARVCQSQFARFDARAATATATNVGAPFFRRVRILRLDSLMPFPAQTAHAAWLSSGPVILSDNPCAWASICRDEPPAHAGDPDLALMLALYAGIWTAASVHKELRVNSVDDIPFRSTSEAAGAIEADIRSKFGARIRPAALTSLPDGVRVTEWVASESRLRRRVADVRNGIVSVTETPLADLPIPPGRMWGMVGNRLLPTG